MATGRGRLRRAMAIMALAAMFGGAVAAAQTSAPVLKSLDRAPKAQDVAPPREYAVKPRIDTAQWTPSGLTLSATGWGRSMDLAHGGGWAQDPDARPGELEAGVAWHGQNVSATAGYTQPTFGGGTAHYPHSFRPQGLVGFSLSFHPR